ncbi:anti-sigma factor [Salinibacillus xinjiangensis]|uniref:Anti-sigma factor n=1 Tax=Salinibacillus xinjiangensis TaxID=1229268 RepID=A0A6G1X8Q6_9BACI|nr:anti-sigma factor [Salinibacillus xinjiangensis]MRG87188.1 anti-sigma factor [Salinibacillus xinjiangensis]
MSEEWKQKLKKYYEGSLTDKEAEQLEKELEKLDAYQEVISEELEQDSQLNNQEDDLPPDKVGKMLKNSIRNARFSLAAYIIMMLLLIYPLMLMASYLYYAFDQKAEDLIQIPIHTVYVTEPNVSLEEMDIERKFGLFTFDVNMDLYKRVGKRDIKLGDWEVTYKFSDAEFPNRNYIVENAPKEIPFYDTKKLYHPEATITNRDGGWERLEKLPEGTVAEVYVSLKDLTKPEDMSKVINGLDVEWRWYAINTGLEAKGKSLEGGYLTPIGYPAQPDPNGWSPYHSRESNEKQFLNSLRFLKKYEQQAVDIAHAKWLDLDYRFNYIEKNGLESYGGVITGPTKEILKLKDNPSIRNISIGEVRLWNW